MTYDEAPSWLQASDAHNIAGEGTSIFEDIATTLSNTPDFLMVSAASAANSFYNTGVAVSNIFSSGDNKTEYRDTGQWISDYDDDLGKYYAENKTAADIVGFVGGSLIPGLGAVKGLQLGQSALRAAAEGAVGSNMRWATNLLAPAAETYVKKEAADLAARSASFSFLNGNALKALGSGIQQGVLESVAFETAVAATMFKSPVLEDMDTWDLIKNAAVGVAFGGAISGIGAAATTYFGVRKLVQNADARQISVTGSTQLVSGTREADKIVAAAGDKALLSAPVTEADVLSRKLLQGESGISITPEVVSAEVSKLESLRLNNIQKLDNEIRSSVRNLAGEDTLGNQLTDIVGKMDSGATFNTFMNMKELARVGDATAYDTRLATAVKDKLFPNTKKAAESISQEEQQFFIRLHSGQVGEVISGSPGITRLADNLTPSQIDKLLAKNPLKFSSNVDFRAAKSAKDVELRWLAARSSNLPLKEDAIVGSHDLPMIEKAIRDKTPSIKILGDDKATRTLQGSEIQDYFNQAKIEVAEAQKNLKHNTGFIELASDIRKDYLESGKLNLSSDDIFNAQASYAKELSSFLGKEISPKDLHYRPKFAKAVYDTQTLQDADGHLLEGMSLIKYREKVVKQATDNVFASYAENLGNLFPEISEDLLRKAWRGGTGAGTFTNAGGGYGTLESMTSYIGSLVSELTRAKIQQLTEGMNPIAVKLAQSQEDAVKFSTLNEIIANTPEKYVLDEAGENLIPLKMKQWLDEGGEGEAPSLFPGTREEIPLDSDILKSAVQEHIARNDSRNLKWKELNASQGNEDRKTIGIFQPIRPNPRDYRHIAFVKDETLVGVGHTRMLFANSSKELEDQIARVPSQYKVYTKGQSEEFYSARGEWQYDKTLHDNYLDTDLLSRGIYSRFFPQTDPSKIVNNWVSDHVAKENTLVKQMVLAKYEKEVLELKRLGEQYSNIASSKTGRDSIIDTLTSEDKNPYVAQIKSMMNVTKVEEVPLLTTLNQSLDRNISRVWDKVTAPFRAGPSEQNVATINKAFDELGFKSAYYDSATALMSNSSMPKGVLTGFVRKANAFLTTTILRLDGFNALNNLLGNTVLFSSEIKGVTDAIRKGSQEGAGELAALSRIAVPGAEGDTILSPAKLISNSFQRLHGPEREALISQYKERGLLPDLSDQYYKSLDAMTLSGSESVKDMTSKIQKLDQAWESFGKAGEKLTGNKWVEQFNRLIAADVMKQITEVAVKNGIMDEKAAWAYVNTFVSRVNGVVRAAERPLMFQGPIGQAIGLFQSYQFNLMQQMFRYIGEGKGKQVAMALGLQSSIYGASSLPGFNLINNSLVGNAAGNDSHKDLYSATTAVFGKTGSDWLMYGAPSNILRASLYTRGDTNPRTWHVVPNPTNPEDIPFISAFAGAIGSIKDATTKAANGAPVWESFLSGIEHMGLSRPLAGLAAVGRSITSPDNQVIATNSKGNIVGSNDLASWSTLIRIAGAKPIDDAVVTGAYYRVLGYAATDRAKREKLGETLKASLISGQMPEASAIEDFAQKYVAAGGKQTGFNQWFMEQYKNTTKTQAEKMAEGLGTSYSKYMQELMGGRDSLSQVP